MGSVDVDDALPGCSHSIVPLGEVGARQSLGCARANSVYAIERRKRYSVAKFIGPIKETGKRLGRAAEDVSRRAGVTLVIREGSDRQLVPIYSRPRGYRSWRRAWLNAVSFGVVDQLYPRAAWMSAFSCLERERPKIWSIG